MIERSPRLILMRAYPSNPSERQTEQSSRMYTTDLVCVDAGADDFQDATLVLGSHFALARA